MLCAEHLEGGDIHRQAFVVLRPGPQSVVAVVATMAYSFIVTVVILKILDVIPGLGLRAEESDESTGLDISHHGERAYVSDGAD